MYSNEPSLGKIDDFGEMQAYQSCALAITFYTTADLELLEGPKRGATGGETQYRPPGQARLFFVP